MSQHHDQPTYPPIDPTTFDLVVVGTGLPESVLAAAASAAGKTVLHLDPNPFYGSHSSSLSLSDLSSFLTSSLPVYSGVEISPSPPELEGQSGKFLLDVSGPRALFCADRAVDLLVRSGASNYVEFKGVDASFVFLEGRLCKVPDSRTAIFKDRELELKEKNQLMRFFKLVQTHLGSGSEVEEEEEVVGKGKRISDVDLETPFVDFLSKMKLPPNIKSSVLLFLFSFFFLLMFVLMCIIALFWVRYGDNMVSEQFDPYPLFCSHDPHFLHVGEVKNRAIFDHMGLV